MATLEMKRLEALDAFIVELNRAASDAILPLFRGDHSMTDKSGPRGFDSRHRRGQRCRAGDPCADRRTLS